MTEVTGLTELRAEILCLLQVATIGELPQILAAKVGAPLEEVREELGKLVGLGYAEFAERVSEHDLGIRVSITEAGMAAGGRPVAEAASLRSARGPGRAGPLEAGFPAKNRAGRTAGALGLNPLIGGDDRLIILCILARNRDGTSLTNLANGAGLTTEETYAKLHPLREVGLAAAELSAEILHLDGRRRLAYIKPAPYLPGLGEAWAWITDRGCDALDRHLDALRRVPGEIKLHNTYSRDQGLEPS